MTTALHDTERGHQRAQRIEARPAEADVAALRRTIDGILNRHPAVGLALGVVRDGKAAFVGRGLAEITSRTPITQDTVFRIGSVSKLFTAIAVMQLIDEGRVDLDAPANDYLRAYRLVPARASFRPATLRDLLTHSAGIPDVRRISDLVGASLTPSGGRPPHLSVAFGERLPSLAAYHRGGLRVVVEPGSAFAYSNHGYATVGQIVEDVTGMPLARWFRERIFEPLGMADTDLVRTERIAARLATGYTFGSRGPRAAEDRDWIGAGAGGVYSTARDLARFVATLLNGGAYEHGRMLERETLATMFEPHYQPDPRLPGMGLGFFRGEAAGHRLVVHDGILPGFNAELLLSPDDGIGVIGLTNGSSGAFAWLELELERLLRELLGLPEAAVRHDIPHHPELWSQLCGRYRFPARVADLRQQLMLGAGAEVFVGDGRLKVRLLTPIPALFRGLPLYPDDPTDPSVFRLDLSPFGMPPVRAVFARVVEGRATEIHIDLGGQPWSLIRVPDPGPRSAWLKPAVGAVAVAGVVTAVRRNQRGASRCVSRR